jgi:acyl-[acyl carrier protein]--UDP-N-acetylglucosamine O-acyltransferase
MVKGERALTVGLNAVGLQRLGWSDEKIASLLDTMVEYFRTGKMSTTNNSEEAKKMVDFFKASKRGVARMKEMPKKIEFKI